MDQYEQYTTTMGMVSRAWVWTDRLGILEKLRQKLRKRPDLTEEATFYRFLSAIMFTLLRKMSLGSSDY